MEKDAITFRTGTKKLCPNLNGKRLGAIADFAYNLGLTRLAGSTLRKRLLSEDYDNAATELMKWVRGGGKVLVGLVRRRAEEASFLI